MNINQLVNDKKDTLAASNKPLNQGVGPDLIEVLATRKLLEEKQAAARDMAMKQEQTGGTIAEQQEQKLLGLTQKEIANQTGGILAQRAQQPQQKKPQQGGIMGAMGGGKPPMGGAPRPPMGGMPSAMGGARPPMMASGGIVGYAKGGDVNAAVAIAQRQIQALGGTTDASSPEYQAKLQKIMQTLTAQSSPEEKDAVQKVLVDAGLKAGPADKVRSGAYVDDDYVFPKDRKGKDTSAAGFYGDLFNFSTGLPKDADREEAKQRINRARGSQFGGAGSPASGEQVQRQVDERGGMAIVDQAMMLGGIGAVKQIVANAGKKYGPKVVNYAKQTLSKGKDFARTPASKPKFKMGADGKPVMTAPGQAASLNTGNLTGAGLGLGGIAYGADAVMGGTKPPTADMGGAGVLRPKTDPNTISAAENAGIDAEIAAQQKGPTVDDAKTFVRDQYNKEAAGGPQIGGDQEFDFSANPNTSKTQVSDKLGDAFNKKVDDRISQDPAKERDAISLAGRFETDQRVGGLKDLYSQRMEEKERLANDPHAQYKRRMANIFATRGAKGQAYRQNVLDSQNKDINLINQRIGDFVSTTNTEVNLMKEVDARAAKAYEVGMTDVAKAMELRAGVAKDNLSVYQKDIELQQGKLTQEADAKIRAKVNYNYAEANRISRESNDREAISDLVETLSEIQVEEMEQANKILDVEERKVAVDKLATEHAKLYLSLQVAALNRLRKLTNIDEMIGGDDGDEAEYSAAETDAFNKQMNQ